MPLYEFKCKCGNKFDIFSTIEKRKARAKCACGRYARRVISPTMIVADLPDYSCPISGKWIEGRSAHEENLKRTDCRVLEPGEHEANQRLRESRNKALERELETSVEKAISELPSDKKEKLATELDHGITANIERL